jgi:CelD/BcsL family acetyltransferase involved in cellulose biosynthesis
MSKYLVKVYKRLDDAQLEAGWKKLQRRENVFPQMYYEWVAAWWNEKEEVNDLYVISVLDQDQEIVGIAPFFIERVACIRVLRSMPVHFGDFFDFLAIDDNAIREILNHLRGFRGYAAIHIFNVNSGSTLHHYLSDSRVPERKVVNVMAPEFAGKSFDEFLLTLSRNTRQSYRKRLRRLAKEGRLELQKIVDRIGYEEKFHHTKRLYNLRWKGGSRPLLDDDYYRMRNAALGPLFDKGLAVLYLLSLNGTVIAYRLGFLHQGTFYDWKTSHDPEYDYYSPGFLSIGLIIESLIQDGYTRLNFMAGDYQYKRSWTNNEDHSYNSEFVSYRKYSLGFFFAKYIVSVRERLKVLVRKVSMKT